LQFQSQQLRSLASLALKLGVPGTVGGALVGFFWSILLGFVVGKLKNRERWQSHLANAPVFAAIVATGLLVGGGWFKRV
jgi:high-affinity Fe2+/Pb2+ permease